MPRRQSFVGLAMCLLLITPPGVFASSHREAPITALDHAADITDFYAFVSYDHPDRVTFIMNVDPFLEPSNGPNFFPFDPNVLYQIKIDNNDNALADVTFNIQFQTQIRAPQLFTGFAGAGNGINAPKNSPAPVAPGTPIVPPAITSLDGPGAAGLSLRQTYTVTMYRGSKKIPLTPVSGSTLYAVPTNIGPRTMPDYEALAKQGIYTVREIAETSAFLPARLRILSLSIWEQPSTPLTSARAAGGGVLTAAQDKDNHLNLAPNAVSGFNVNTIAIEVPICYLTSDGNQHKASDKRSNDWSLGDNLAAAFHHPPFAQSSGERGGYSQIQRLGNPLINELIIGTGFKDTWSMSQPVNDSNFASFDLDPTLARIFNAVYGINIPPPPRTDLLPLVTYAPPIAAPGTPAGPIADLLRLNTGVAPTPEANRSRLGLLAGDGAGFPNGRRLTDDVVDIAARVVAGGVLNPKFNVAPNNLIGDGVAAPDVPTQETFPYVHFAYSGRDSRHIDPSETGCGDQPTLASSNQGEPPPADQGGSTTCPVM